MARKGRSAELNATSVLYRKHKIIHITLFAQPLFFFQTLGIDTTE